MTVEFIGMIRTTDTSEIRLSRHNPIERHYRDVLCSRIHTPQDDTILTTTGSAVLGAAAAAKLSS